MALATIIVPSGFQPIAGNSLVFTFNESALAGKVNYRVEIEIWDADAGVILLGGLKFAYTPSATGDVSADISSPCRTLLDFAKIGSQFATGLKLNNHFRRIFIKYQAVWDAGSDAQVSLVAMPTTVYNGTRHIQSDPLGTYPAEYIITDNAAGNGKPLVPTSRLQVWGGQRAFVDFMLDQSNKNNRIVLDIDNGTGSYPLMSWRPTKESKQGIFGVDFVLPNFSDIGRVQIDPIQIYARLQENFIEWSTTATSLRSIYFANPTNYGQTFTPTATGFVSITFYNVVKLGDPSANYIFSLYATAAGLPTGAPFEQQILSLIFFNSGADMTIDFVSPLTNGVKYAIVVTCLNDGINDVNNCLQLNRSNTSIYANGDEVTKTAGVWSILSGDINGGVTMGLATYTKGTYQIDLRDSSQMQNIVYLAWLSDIGGRVSWGFDFNQDSGYKIETDRRAKTLRLFAAFLLPDQWRMINEINKVGVRYSDYKKIGQRVKDLTQVAAYQDVYVVPTADRYFTRQVQASTEVNIEYQELSQNLVP